MSENIRYLSPCCGSKFKTITLMCLDCRHQFADPIKMHGAKETLKESYGTYIVDAEGLVYTELCPVCLSARFEDHICRCDKCGGVFQADDILKEIMEHALPQ